MENIIAKCREFTAKHAAIIGVPGLHIDEYEIKPAVGARWSGRCLYWKISKRIVIQVQENLARSDRSLERIIAHEVIHAALYRQYGWTAKLIGHGHMFIQLMNRVNAVMGDNFVTVKCGFDYETPPLRKPITLLMFRKAPGERPNISWFARETPKVRALLQVIAKTWATSETRLVETTDSTWAQFPRAGSRRYGRVAVEHMDAAQKLWDQAAIVVVPK